MVNSLSVVTKAWESFSQNFGFYIAAGLSFFGVAILMVMLMIHVFTPSGNFGLIIWGLLFALLYAKLAVVIHRCILMGENQFKDMLSFKQEDFKFFLAMMGFFLVLMFGVFLIGIFGSLFSGGGKMSVIVFAFIPMLILGVVASRLVMIFPSLAVSNGDSLGDVWDAGQNHKWMLFFLVIVFPYLTGKLLEAIPDNTILQFVIMTAISQLVLMFEVMILSHCFDELMIKPHENDRDEDVSESSI